MLQRYMYMRNYVLSMPSTRKRARRGFLVGCFLPSVKGMKRVEGLQLYGIYLLTAYPVVCNWCNT